VRGDSAIESGLRLEGEGVRFRGRKVDMKQDEFKFSGRQEITKPGTFESAFAALARIGDRIRAVKASAKQPRGRRFSTVGAALTIAIAGAIGYVAWHIIPRSRTRAAQARQFKPCKSRPSKFQPERTLDCVLRVSSHFLDRSKGPQAACRRPGGNRTAEYPVGFQQASTRERADFHARDPHESAARIFPASTCMVSGYAKPICGVQRSAR